MRDGATILRDATVGNLPTLLALIHHAFAHGSGHTDLVMEKDLR